jgi:molecular chaperone DnaK (HSP70)
MGNDLLSVGIDLGTSNSAIAVTDTIEKAANCLPIAQITAPGTVDELSTLPSALYLPLEGELEGAHLPWSKKTPDIAVGLFARERGALAPDRLVSSAKSWLCHPLVDRRAKLLPWASEAPVEKLSPVQASEIILTHLRCAFEKTQGKKLADSPVVLTVPASFDEVARTLTRQAAEAAGIAHATLLEEPQAAFYAWIAGTEGTWRQAVKPGDVVLVVDVGGGTTDFSLIAVSEEDGTLRLERISVGEHLLLGGDNMDLALAYALRSQLEADGASIDPWQLLTLVRQHTKHQAFLSHRAADIARRFFPANENHRSSGPAPFRGHSGIRATLRCRTGDNQTPRALSRA